MGLGSGIRKKPIPDPRVKKAPDPGSATLIYVLYTFTSYPAFISDKTKIKGIILMEFLGCGKLL